MDVYDVLAAFEVVEPELQHLVKKALAAGKRGHKDYETDLHDIRSSIVCLIDRHNKWKEHNKLAEKNDTENVVPAAGIQERIGGEVTRALIGLMREQRLREAQDQLHRPRERPYLYP